MLIKLFWFNLFLCCDIFHFFHFCHGSLFSLVIACSSNSLYFLSIFVLICYCCNSIVITKILVTSFLTHLQLMMIKENQTSYPVYLVCFYPDQLAWMSICKGYVNFLCLYFRIGLLWMYQAY